MTPSVGKYFRRRLSELLSPLCCLPLAEPHGVHIKGAKSLQTHQPALPLFIRQGTCHANEFLEPGRMKRCLTTVGYVAEIV
jgi:hypothetical protein